VNQNTFLISYEASGTNDEDDVPSVSSLCKFCIRLWTFCESAGLLAQHFPVLLR
jgi:hypothetical protein